MGTVAAPRRIVVVGAGMVGHRFVESLLSRPDAGVAVTLLGDEGRHPYDRVGLTGFFAGRTPAELTLSRDAFDDARIEVPEQGDDRHPESDDGPDLVLEQVWIRGGGDHIDREALDTGRSHDAHLVLDQRWRFAYHSQRAEPAGAADGRHQLGAGGAAHCGRQDGHGAAEHPRCDGATRQRSAPRA